MSNYIHGHYDSSRDVANVIEEMMETLLQEKDDIIEELNEKIVQLESELETLKGEMDV